MTPSKYDREYTARHDDTQATLNPSSPTFLKQKQTVQVNVTAIYTGQYMCPFCLHTGKIEQYLISTKKGYHRGLGHCPECNNQMQLKTLTANMTPEEFAEFMFSYSCQGGWQKVKFKIWSQRLAQIGWSTRFWARYHQLKGEGDGTEKYQDYLQRTQEEWAREQGLIE
jgi:transcription elongation factor Elf1